MTEKYRFYGCLLAAFVLLGLLAPVAALAEGTAIYTEGFETDSGGYTVDGNAPWKWGAPSKSSGPLVANSGTNCWGTDQTSVIVGTLEGNLYSPPITIPSLGDGEIARVQFYAYIDVNYEKYGEGDFSISADGMQTWQLLARFYEKMAGGWQRYVFNVSDYAGKEVHLRFRAYMQSTDPGFYIDDVALKVEAVPSPTKLMTLEANEDAAAKASCPWVYTWDGAGFVRDNDIYSVGRYPNGEMRDYYLLQQPLVAQDSHYTVEIREVESEDSWTDLLGLLAVDHPPGVAAAPDGNGNVLAYRPEALVKPISAITNTGSDLLAMVSAKDNVGFKAYSGDYIDLDFGSVDVSSGSRVLLRMKGFGEGEGVVAPFTGPPAILVQVRDAHGDLHEIGRLNPRFEWSEGVFDLSPYLPDPGGQRRIRLTSISHDVKYHEIDVVALATGPPPAVTITELPLLSASLGETDVLSLLSLSDNHYVQLASGNKFSASFGAAPQQPGMIRDFILVSEGYYVPKSSTFFIYTWDGSQWLQQDSYSFAATDSERSFNLSAFLPDPAGEYKVRIWQDYSNYPAAIDAVRLQVGSQAGVLGSAEDLRDQSSILELVQNSDDIKLEYPRDPVDKLTRNRWSEYRWTLPPSTFTLAFMAEDNGSLIGSTSQSVNAGADATAVTAVAASGYHFVLWTGTNGFVSSVDNPLIVANVTADQTITAHFSPNPVNGACGSSDGGTFTASPVMNLCSAGIASPVSGSGHPWNWNCEGSAGGTIANCMATVQNWSVTPTYSSNGALTPATPQSVDHGATTSFTITPSSGYQLASITGCGGLLSGTTYTTGEITGNCTVSASFSAISVIIPHDGIVNIGNSVPTIVDALAVLRHVVGVAFLTPNQQVHADVAPLAPDGKPMGNEVVDIADVIIILRRVIDAVSW